MRSLTARCAGVQEGQGVSRPRVEKQGQLRSRTISEAVRISLPRAILQMLQLKSWQENLEVPGETMCLPTQPAGSGLSIRIPPPTLVACWVEPSSHP